MSDYYEEDYDNPCPQCGHTPTYYRDCGAFGCEEGYIDEFEDDPINFFPGESFIMCTECFGSGIEEWCPNCGCDISKYKYFNQDEKETVDH